jgi:hypothetical protein
VSGDRVTKFSSKSQSHSGHNLETEKDYSKRRRW